MELHSRDRYYLSTFGADLENKELLAKYEVYRKVWRRANNVGELPHAINMLLACSYPKQTEVKDKPKKLAKAR